MNALQCLKKYYEEFIYTFQRARHNCILNAVFVKKKTYYPLHKLFSWTTCDAHQSVMNQIASSIDDSVLCYWVVTYYL